jgi:hypothetical protein
MKSFIFVLCCINFIVAQTHTGDEIVQPDPIIKIASTDTTGLQGKIKTTWHTAWVVCKGFQAAPGCHDSLVVEINPFSESDTNFWVTLSAPSGVWVGQIFRRIRALHTTVPLDSIRCAVRDF